MTEKGPDKVLSDRSITAEDATTLVARRVQKRLTGFGETPSLDRIKAILYAAEREHLANYGDVMAERDRLLRIAAHLCVDSDAVGRSCGECVPCRLWAAAKRMADRAPFDDKLPSQEAPDGL